MVQSFRIHGQIYHLISPLYPKEANKPGYGQLYIFNIVEAMTRRFKGEFCNPVASINEIKVQTSVNGDLLSISMVN
jgi:hypothetical protein